MLAEDARKRAGTETGDPHDPARLSVDTRPTTRTPLHGKVERDSRVRRSLPIIAGMSSATPQAPGVPPIFAKPSPTTGEFRHLSTIAGVAVDLATPPPTTLLVATSILRLTARGCTGDASGAGRSQSLAERAAER